MTKTKLFTILMLPVVAFLGWGVFNSIYGTIKLSDDVKRSEEAVINKLKIIRIAETAFNAENKRFTANWDSLINFVKHDTIDTYEKREIIIPRQPSDPRFHLGDSIRIETRLVSRDPALEKLFPKDEYPNFNPDRLAYIPGTKSDENPDGLKFTIFAGTVKKGNVNVSVVEVVDTYPMDKSRNEDAASPKRRFLRFGSKEDATTSGNWE